MKAEDVFINQVLLPGIREYDKKSDMRNTHGTMYSSGLPDRIGPFRGVIIGIEVKYAPNSVPETAAQLIRKCRDVQRAVLVNWSKTGAPVYLVCGCGIKPSEPSLIVWLDAGVLCEYKPGKPPDHPVFYSETIEGFVEHERGLGAYLQTRC